MKNLALFALMAFIWGATWAAAKIGIGNVPPLLLAWARYAVTALILLSIVRGIRTVLAGPAWARVIVTGTLVNAGTYALLFWAMRTIPSGISAIINLSLTPILLSSLAVMVGAEKLRHRHIGALVLGVAGLAVLFGPKTGEGSGIDWLGVGAIVAGTVCFCVGSVLSMPLVREHRALQVAGAQAIVGAIVLSPAWLFVDAPMSVVRAFGTMPVLGSIALLSLGGTIVAYTIYLHLVDEWGPSRSGLYAFVSPVVALVIGWAAFGEHIGVTDVLASAILLLAAAVALAPWSKPHHQQDDRGSGASLLSQRFHERH